MEAQQGAVKIIIRALIDTGHKSLSQKVVSYLDMEDLELLNQILEQSSQENIFGQLIRTNYFIQKYLNHVDRSFYYNFYEEEQYLNLETAHVSLLTNNHSNCFLQFPKRYRQIINFAKSLLPQLECKEQIGEEIQRMITQPQIPLPKLKRENEGMFCKTAFQNFLIALKYRQSAYEEGIPCFDDAKQYFESQDEKYLERLFIKAGHEESLAKKIKSLRFAPYEINCTNYHEYLIQKNSLHNFLVSIFALTDVWLTSIHAYLESLDDPFHQYIQLITRYSIYRNFVIQVEESLSFAFQQYNQLYSEVFGGDKPQYRFWRAAMTKWLLKFENFHDFAAQIYYFCFNKLRTQHLLQFLTLKEKQEPEIYMQIKNKVALREYELQTSQEAFPFQTNNGVKDFFESNPEQYQIVVIEFMEYMIDLSVNEETVHWCGHSQQQLSQPYFKFQKFLLMRNKEFIGYLRNCPGEDKQRIIFERQFFQNQIQFLTSLEVKPMTLLKIVECCNLQLSDNPVLDENFKGIIYDYQSNDELLKYFNTKANIKFSLNAEQLLFYSINPLVSAEELLTKSTNSTNCTVNDRDEVEEDDSGCQFQYCSESSSVDDYEQENIIKAELDPPPISLNSKKFGGLSKKMSMREQNTFESQKQEKTINNPYSSSVKQEQKQQKNQYIQKNLQNENENQS